MDVEESHFQDFKSRMISPGKLSETLVAFANSDGGEIIVGVDEDKASNSRIWNGFDTVEKANAHFQIIESIFPLQQFCQSLFVKCTSYKGLVMLISVQKTPDIKFATDRTAYVRRGAQNLPYKDNTALRQLEFEKGIHSYEDYFIPDSIKVLEGSTTLINFINHVVPKRTPAEWLSQQMLVRDNSLSVAGNILFSDEPQVLLPKSSIKIYRYKTDDQTGTRKDLEFDPISIDGPAYTQITRSVTKTVSIIQGISVLRNKKMVNVSYPREALHEVITNAVIHRDYSRQDDIHVRIFDNRVEVQSPGRLPGHVTPFNILKTRFARNPKITRILNKFPDPPNKDVGEGLKTTFDAMREMRLRQPTIQQPEESVLVTLRHESLAANEERILQHIRSYGKIKNSEARKVCSIESEQKMRKILERMIEAGEIERVPGKERGAAAYRIKDKETPLSRVPKRTPPA